MLITVNSPLALGRLSLVHILAERLCSEEEQLALALFGAVSSGTCPAAVAVRPSVRQSGPD